MKLVGYESEATCLKLSTRSTYGLRAMMELAGCFGQGPMSLQAVAQRQNIPRPYLEQLVPSLREAGLLNSTRGARGGYALSISPQEITVGNIVEALEGSIAPVDCVEQPCQNAKDCALHGLYSRMHQGTLALLRSITLQDLVQDHAKTCTICEKTEE